MVVRKLQNKKLDKPITFEDIPERKLDDIRDFDYTDDDFRTHRYRVGEYEPGTELVQGKHVGDRTKFKGSPEEAPIQIYRTQDREEIIDEKKLVHEIYQEWGEGRINIFKIGGYATRESIFENRFIEKIA